MAPDRADPEKGDERTALIADRTAGQQQVRDGHPAKGNAYINLTPSVEGLFFCHSYYAYTFVFYMFLILFYKDYALEYPIGRQQKEMLLLMITPIMHHALFYFGHRGCVEGSPRDLCSFIFCCTCLMWVLMYFLFAQAYIVPLESKLCFVSATLVAVEGMCGVVNILQTVTSRPLPQNSAVFFHVMLYFITVGCLIVFEFMPAPEEEVMTRQNPKHLMPKV